jgi:hypothetical protein
MAHKWRTNGAQKLKKPKNRKTALQAKWLNNAV